MALLEGYIIGLALIVLAGPVFFLLLGTTLDRGKKSGFAVATGILASDILAVTICVFGFSDCFLHPSVVPWVGVGGGLMLLGFSLRYIISPPSSNTPPAKPFAHSQLNHFARGFLINFVNPFVFMVWLGIIAMGANRNGAKLDFFLFLAGSILGVFTLDTTKVLLAHRIKSMLNPGFLKWVFKGSGILMGLFGLRLVIVGLL